MNIADRLDRLRIRKGFTWEELGHNLDLSRTMLHYVRTGRRSLSAKTMVRLREAEETAGIIPPVTQILLPGVNTRDAIMNAIAQALAELPNASPAMRNLLATYIKQLATKLETIVRREERGARAARTKSRKSSD